MFCGKIHKKLIFHRNKPYDSKKSVWMTDGEGGFVEGLLQSDDGKKAVVMVGHEVNFLSKLIHVCPFLIKNTINIL